jgi:hypothetical protein
MSNSPSLTPGRVVWRELMSNDFNRAKVFYSELFGWGTQVMPMPSGDYTLFMVGEKMVSGGMQMPPEVQAPTHWASYVSVEDVEATLAKAEAHGGKSLYPVMDVPDVGRLGGIMDPQGGVFAIMRSSSGDPPQSMPNVGEFCWETVMQQDTGAAKQFYTAVLGWNVQSGPGGMDVFAAGDCQIADLQPANGMPSCWMTYVVVSELEATRDRVAGLGGNVLEPLIEVPTVGRIAVVADPTGGVIGLFQPSFGG